VVRTNQLEERVRKLEEEVDQLKKVRGFRINLFSLKKELLREAVIPFEQKISERVGNLEDRIKNLESKILQNKSE